MARIVAVHGVEDIPRWLEGKAERAAAIESGSGSNVTDFVAADGSNNVAVSADVADMDELGAMLGSPQPENRCGQAGRCRQHHPRPEGS